MLTFLRRIRKNLIESGSARKYLLYAIGEIALVVIGILIALQINNWNEWRKDRINEKVIINNLHSEFNLNRELLNKVKKDADTHFDANLRLMQLMGKQEKDLVNINIDSLIYSSWGAYIFSPNQSVLNGLLTSERIEIITNERIRNLLFQWTSEMHDNADLFDNLNNVSENKYDDYLTKHYSLKDIDMYSELSWGSTSKLISDKYKIFQDIEFENLVDNMAFVNLQYRKSMDKLEKIIDDILMELEKG